MRRYACSFDGKQAGKEDQQRNDDRIARSKFWSNFISEFFDYRDFGYRELEMSRTPTSGVPKCRNAKTRKGASLGMLNIGILVTGRWSDKDPSTSGVPRNVKTRKGTSLRMLNIGISVTGRWSDKDPSSSGVPKCRKEKRRNSRSRHIIPGFRIPGDGEVRDSQHQESRSAEI
jgi:hypothetical protein